MAMLVSYQPIRKDVIVPTPEKTTRDAIVAAARELIEVHGVAGITMQSVAEVVGVRAPSLYKRVRDREELIELVVAATIEDLTARLDAERQPDARARVVALGTAMRTFAHEHPVGYGLIFGAQGAPRPQVDAAARSVAPVLDAVAQLTGQEHALDGARLLTAWATGFLGMELGDRLQLGGDVDAAWNWGLQRIVDALAAPEASSAPGAGAVDQRRPVVAAARPARRPNTTPAASPVPPG